MFRPNDELTGPAAEAAMKRMARRCFLTGAVAAGLGGAGWLALRNSGDDDGIPWFLRRVLGVNERIAQATFSPNRLAPTFSASRARKPRVNGTYGMREQTHTANWTLRLRFPGGLVRDVPLDALKSLPRVELVAELKCVEGWSEIVQWAGVRFADFSKRYGPAAWSYEYVSLSTPDNGYYVGMDVPSLMHPQTILADTMNGAPLPHEHGGPIRLVAPTKYGVKNIKRIGHIAFVNQRPADYWAERGYDWYLGL
jgi:DMSO/TMAO reductase YedYZ molybdopterin-dependent catalytic subunit